MFSRHRIIGKHLLPAWTLCRTYCMVNADMTGGLERAIRMAVVEEETEGVRNVERGEEMVISKEVTEKILRKSKSESHKNCLRSMPEVHVLGVIDDLQ
jgi:hypothetical protein